MTRRLFLGTLLFAPRLLWADDSPRVRFLHPPRIVTDQNLVTYHVHVPIHDENRQLAYAAFEGDIRIDYSEHDLWSEQRKTLWDFTRRYPAGEILLIAAVFGDHGEVARATHQVSVLPWG